MNIACMQCKLKKEMRSHNFWYNDRSGSAYLCDECRLRTASVDILKAISRWCPHLFNAEKIKHLLESL